MYAKVIRIYITGSNKESNEVILKIQLDIL